MILTFKVFREKIESGEKTQTIRKFSPEQYRRFLNCYEKANSTGRYNLFWHNPRNGGVRIKDVVPSEAPVLIRFDPNHGVIIITRSNGDHKVATPEQRHDLARRDGFRDFPDMLAWFLDEYDTSLYQERFMVIRWLP